MVRSSRVSASPRCGRLPADEAFVTYLSESHTRSPELKRNLAVSAPLESIESGNGQYRVSDSDLAFANAPSRQTERVVSPRA